MNRLFLLALVGFVLAIGLALPFSEDEDKTSDNEMKEIPNDFKAEDGESDLDWDNEDNSPDEQEDEEDEEDDDIDDDDDDEEDEDEEDDVNPLSNPLKKSSDPFVRFRRIFRGGRRIIRRFRPRRSRRGGRRVRGWFRRRKGGRG